MTRTARTITTGAAALTAATMLLPTALPAQERCEFRDDVELRGSAVDELDVDAGAGTLVIRGADEVGVIRVTATLCASDRDRLEALEVTLDGDRLETDYPDGEGGWLRFGSHYARIDLMIDVPAGTHVHVEDSSGRVRIAGVGDVELEDGSGNVQLEDVGSVSIVDGSGSLSIEGSTGDVEVIDGSGSIGIRGVTGDVVVEDGSGSINIAEVGGSVRIVDPGSGGVNVRDVTGDLVVTDGRRERIRYSNIGGTLDLPAARRRGSPMDG